MSTEKFMAFCSRLEDNALTFPVPVAVMQTEGSLPKQIAGGLGYHRQLGITNKIVNPNLAKSNKINRFRPKLL